MNRVSHRIFGVACAVTWCSLTQQNLPQTVLVSAVAAVVAPWPDVDQRRRWREMHEAIPDEFFSHGGPLRHRGITHWWGTAVLFAVVLCMIDTVTAGQISLILIAMMIGWCSHILGDFLVGARSRYRGPGVPLAPWWRHVGIGIKTGSFADVVIIGLSAVYICTNIVRFI